MVKEYQDYEESPQIVHKKETWDFAFIQLRFRNAVHSFNRIPVENIGEIQYNMIGLLGILLATIPFFLWAE